MRKWNAHPEKVISQEEFERGLRERFPFIAESLETDAKAEKVEYEGLSFVAEAITVNERPEQTYGLALGEECGEGANALQSKRRRKLQ